MNFLLHRHVTFAAHGSALAGLGAMLPDLWRMADRSVRPASPISSAWEALAVTSALEDARDEPPGVRDVMRGIEHHLEVDLWFHAHDVFTEGERRTADALRAARTEAKKLTLFAHPLWEMCLDGALVRRLGAERVRASVAEAFTEGADAARAAARAHHFARVEGAAARAAAFDARMDWLGDELSRGPWIEGYARPAGLVRGLEGMRRRLGLAPFDEGERDRLATAIAALEPHAGDALDAVVSRRP